MDPSWKTIYAKHINDMWLKSHVGKYYITVYCDQCGGSEAGKCECARRRFIEQLSYKELSDHLNSQDMYATLYHTDWKKTYSYVINEMWYNRSGGGVCLWVVCRVCGGGSTSNCLCRKKEFTDSVTFYELIEHMKKSGKSFEKYKSEAEQRNQFKTILERGELFCPATKHFAQGVMCDKCNKNGLSVCIGYQTMDLCLSCANEVASWM